LDVYDVFLRPIKKPHSGFRAQKNVPEETRTKALCAVCGFLEAEPQGGEA
jgi:hypothetical protein